MHYVHFYLVSCFHDQSYHFKAYTLLGFISHNHLEKVFIRRNNKVDSIESIHMFILFVSLKCSRKLLLHQFFLDKILWSLLIFKKFYLLAHLSNLVVHKRQKNHLTFKGNFYFQTLSKIFISTPLTTDVHRLIVYQHNLSSFPAPLKIMARQSTF